MTKPGHDATQQTGFPPPFGNGGTQRASPFS